MWNNGCFSCSTIELPYTTRLEAAKADRLDLITTSSIVSERPNKKLSKTKSSKSKIAGQYTTPTVTFSSTRSQSGR